MFAAGRAQAARYLLEDNDIEYEFVVKEKDSWAEHKPKTVRDRTEQQRVILT